MFDKVYNESLVRKVKARGISGDVLWCTKDWLRNSKQRVCMNEEESDWGLATTGIPQDSILGPLLFIIYHVIWI